MSPFCPRRGLSQGSPARGLTGPAGWGQGSDAPGTWFAKGSAIPPHPPYPCRVGPAPCGRWCSSLPQREQCGWVPGITHPLYPPAHTRPGTIPARTAPAVHVRHAGTDCSNTRFWRSVGEPRGVRTHCCFRVPGWLLEVNEVYTAV